jgi:hypothetical protein
MCWNIEVSLLAAAYGFAMCYYFYKRNYSTRDPWYALFLCSFTCTQLLDAFFWIRENPTTHNIDCDATNIYFTKFAVTPVMFSQVIVLTLFPGGGNDRWKPYVRLLVAAVIAGVAYIAECTYVFQTTGGALPGPTLIYWGFIPAWYLFLLGVALWSISALLFIFPTIYATNILLVGGINLLILQYIDGTIYLVSKLCFYCLQLSILWYIEPYWSPPVSAPYEQLDLGEKSAAEVEQP